MRRIMTLAVIFAFTAVPALAGPKTDARAQGAINGDRANIAGLQAREAKVDAGSMSAAQKAKRDASLNAQIDHFNDKINGELHSCPNCH